MTLPRPAADVVRLAYLPGLYTRSTHPRYYPLYEVGKLDMLVYRGGCRGDPMPVVQGFSRVDAA